MSSGLIGTPVALPAVSPIRTIARAGLAWRRQRASPQKDMGWASRNCETNAQAFVRVFAKILCDTLLTSFGWVAYITVIDGRGVAGGLYARLWELVLASFWYGVPVCFFGFGGF
ncbi:hypothetical protein, partial [Aureimonas psammosilenae]|uniref:hypothetical protein n=1 Tax=Aureimonas psammosilenae TaxID=2495496 RepID=UPI001AEEE332